MTSLNPRRLTAVLIGLLAVTYFVRPWSRWDGLALLALAL